MGAMNSSQNRYRMSCKPDGSIYAVVEPSGTSLWRVTGETMTMNTAELTIKLSCFGANIFLAKRTAEGLMRIGIVAPVTF